jgi:membrane protease YdiL (CAAX protease family)
LTRRAPDYIVMQEIKSGPEMERTWKTKTAGILAIIIGALCVIEWGVVAVLGIFEWGWLAIGGLLGAGGIIEAIAAIVIAIGIVAIVGGIFALRRKRWRLALAGSICAIFCLWFIPILVNVPLAIAAIVLVVLGKSEFE